MTLLKLKICDCKDVTVENTVNEILEQSDSKWTILNECYWDSKTTADGYSCISKRRKKVVLTDDIYDITELN